MILSEAIKILEANGFGAEITNKRLRKKLDDAGYSDVHLIKGDGYLYVDSDDAQHQDWLNALDSTSIYLNSFNQQSPEEWFNDIRDMLRRGRNEFIDKHPDEPDDVNEDFGIGVGGMTGADQGIPMGGDCKAVVAKRIDGGKPACRFRNMLKKRKKNKGK